jgi:hypothetical protein
MDEKKMVRVAGIVASIELTLWAFALVVTLLAGSWLLAILVGTIIIKVVETIRLRSLNVRAMSLLQRVREDVFDPILKMNEEKKHASTNAGPNRKK